jgi:hypothetical protein
MRLVCSLGLALAALLPVGCAAVSAQPDTPAAKVTFRELNERPTPRGERFYGMVFGAESHPKLARFTHSWVTVVRVPAAAAGTDPVPEVHTISWMPATLSIHPLNPCVEPGVNLDLHTSIVDCLRKCERVSMWGPYEIPPGLYRKVLLQKEFIDSGAVGYQCIDTFGEAGLVGNGNNCIHAITDADAEYDRQAYPLAFFGDAASEHMLEQVVARGGVPDPTKTHDWLIPALKLDQYPIVRRAYQGPPPGAEGSPYFLALPTWPPEVNEALKERAEPRK